MLHDGHTCLGIGGRSDRGQAAVMGWQNNTQQLLKQKLVLQFRTTLDVVREEEDKDHICSP